MVRDQVEDDVDGESDSSEGAESSKEWFEDPRDLLKPDRPVGAEEVDFDFSNWNDNDIEFLDKQTERTLDRHADIQQNQRNQAYSVLRTTMVIIGALIALLIRAVPFLRSLEFRESIPLWRAVTSFFLLFLIATWFAAIAVHLIAIVDSTVDVLSPKSTKFRILGKMMGINILGPRPRDEEEGGGVRSVSILDELIPIVHDPGQGVRKEVIGNRLNRIRRNEKAINQNNNHLQNTFQRAKFSLVRTIAIFLVSSITLMLLGVEIP